MSEPTTETLRSTLARKWVLEVDTSATSTPVWVRVRGITAMSPSIDATTQDDSDYDSNGWGSDAKTMQKWSFTGTVKRGLGVTTNVYDPGQEALRVAADQFGTDAVVHVRWYDGEGGPEAYTGYAMVQWDPQGGGADALDTANFTLNGQGERTTIANPNATDYDVTP